MPHRGPGHPDQRHQGAENSEQAVEGHPVADGPFPDQEAAGG